MINRSPVWFSEKEYARILDELVVVCVDTLLYHPKKGVYLGLRKRLPLYEWWIFGGRMRAHETFIQAARRGLERELGLKANRDPQEIGFFDLVWDRREEPPQENGCHVLLCAMLYRLDDEEAEMLQPAGNDHSQGKWFTKSDLESTNFHPKLKQIIELSRVSKLVRV